MRLLASNKTELGCCVKLVGSFVCIHSGVSESGGASCYLKKICTRFGRSVRVYFTARYRHLFHRDAGRMG